MKLIEVAITGFRSIEGRTLVPIRKPTLLAGHNDAGKSAIIDSIAFLLGGYSLHERDRTYCGVDESGNPERVDTTCVEGTFELSESESETLGMPSVVSIRRIARGGTGAALELLTEVPEDERYHDLDKQKVEVLRDRLKSLSQDTSGLKNELVERLTALSMSATKKPAWTAASPDLKRSLPRLQRFDATSSQNPEDAIRSTLQTSYKAHLASDDMQSSVQKLIATLEKKVATDAETLRAHIMANCSDIGDVQISPVIQLDGGLKATEVSVSNTRGEDVYLGQSGTGRARRVALAVWEYNARLLEESAVDTILLYDEPDTHLDYNNQRGFMDLLLKQASLQNVRVVVATHSMNLIDGVDIGDVFSIRHEDSRTAVDSLADDSDVGKHLGSIAASLGLRNTVLLHERLFVGVEGETESRSIPVLFKLATGRQLESCGIALWPCDNNDGALRFAKYLVAHNRNVVMLVDQDSRDLKMFKDDQLKKFGLDPARHLLTIGDVNEIEDAFADEQWVSCANTNWPRIDGKAWVDADFVSMRTGKFSKNLYDTLKRECVESPSGKPEMLSQLVLTLDGPDDVPRDLRAAFDRLRKLAE